MDAYLADAIIYRGHSVLSKTFDHDTFNIYLPLFSRHDGPDSRDSIKYFYHLRKTVFTIFAEHGVHRFNLHMSILRIIETLITFLGSIPKLAEIFFGEILENETLTKLMHLGNRAVIRMPYYESGRKLLGEIVKNNKRSYCAEYCINYCKDGNLNIAKIIYETSKFTVSDLSEGLDDGEFTLETVEEYIAELRRLPNFHELEKL